MTNKEQVAKLLEAAARFIQDARSETISKETRFDAAYKAVIQYSTVALYGNGYRPAKNRPGHHQTMIQSLVHSISLNNDELPITQANCSMTDRLLSVLTPQYVCSSTSIVGSTKIDRTFWIESWSLNDPTSPNPASSPHCITPGRHFVRESGSIKITTTETWL
jgi:hypothetical protein